MAFGKKKTEETVDGILSSFNEGMDKLRKLIVTQREIAEGEQIAADALWQKAGERRSEAERATKVIGNLENLLGVGPAQNTGIPVSVVGETL